jgi:preprotein translocase subunit SecE
VASGRVRDAAAPSVGDAAATSFGRENQNGEADAEVLGEPGLELATDGAPDPIAHAAPDAEVAEARIARAGVEFAAAPEDEVAAEPEHEVAAEPEDEVAAEPDGAAAESEIPDEAELAPVQRARAGTVAPSPWLGARLLAFLDGSWRELHRVQWPDRRQVLQATGVVIGFVIVAAVFLGVADLVASKVVNFVIYGK